MSSDSRSLPSNKKTNDQKYEATSSRSQPVGQRRGGGSAGGRRRARGPSSRGGRACPRCALLGPGSPATQAAAPASAMTAAVRKERTARTAPFIGRTVAARAKPRPPQPAHAAPSSEPCRPSHARRRLRASAGAGSQLLRRPGSPVAPSGPFPEPAWPSQQESAFSCPRPRSHGDDTAKWKSRWDLAP